MATMALPPAGVDNPQTTVNSRGSGGALASLQPMPVALPQFSNRTRAVMAVRRIEFLRVVSSVGNSTGDSYEIHVFYKSPQHHITLNQFTNQRSIPSREPDVVVSRSLTELTKLHTNLFKLARTGHRLKPCDFCLSVITNCGYSRVKPQRSMTWLHSRETVAEKLSIYLTEVLDVVITARAFHTSDCAGQQNIPLVLHRFLQPKAAQTS